MSIYIHAKGFSDILQIINCKASRVKRRYEIVLFAYVDVLQLSKICLTIIMTLYKMDSTKTYRSKAIATGIKIDPVIAMATPG